MVNTIFEDEFVDVFLTFDMSFCNSFAVIGGVSPSRASMID